MLTDGLQRFYPQAIQCIEFVASTIGANFSLVSLIDPKSPVIDLMKALKQSIEKAKPKQKAAPEQRKRKTASSDS